MFMILLRAKFAFNALIVTSGPREEEGVCFHMH